MSVQITDLANQSEAIREQAAHLLVHEFSEPRGWPTPELAREEVASVLQGGFAFGALDGDILLGWVGGLAEYAGRVGELQPRGAGEKIAGEASAGSSPRRSSVKRAREAASPRRWARMMTPG